MDTIITNQYCWDAKSTEDHPFEELGDHSNIMSRAWNGLYPFRNIVNRHENMLVAPLTNGRAHEIDAPNIKYLNLMNIVEGHLILPY